MKNYNIKISFEIEDFKEYNSEIIEEFKCFLNTSNSQIRHVIITDSNNKKWLIKINSIKNYNVDVTVKEYVKKYEYIKKNKNKKLYFKQNQKRNIISTIGLDTAKMDHAVDQVEEIFIPLKDFLQINQEPFTKQFMYTKDENDNYVLLRHKNLFSEFVDEISDFERFTYISRNENRLIYISSKDDKNILEYEYTKSNLMERKFAREFAKLIFQNKSTFKDKEILSFLKNQLIYIKVEKVIEKENKIVWDKINTESMKFNTLEKSQTKLYKERKKKRIKYYRSKRVIKKQYRYQLKNELSKIISEL